MTSYWPGRIPTDGPVASVVWRPAAGLGVDKGRTLVRGAPQRVSAPEAMGGDAVFFDGVGDALVMPENPLAGADRFTVEALFSVAAGGPAEQRFAHIHSSDTTDRVLLETRRGDSSGATWYADTIVSSGDTDSILADPRKLHPTEAWHSLALTCDGERMRQFVDGVLELEKPFIARPLPPGVVCLGMRMNHISPFRGLIAALRFSRFPRPHSELWRLPDHVPASAGATRKETST